MALNAAIEWEVRNGGSDNNGGGFKAGATGTDRSQQAAAHVAIDNATITTSITTNVITFTGGYTPTAADIGNVVQMLTGTNVTAGFYEITAQTSTTWTVDRNVVTSGTTTNATGNMGGALATPGKAAGAGVAYNTTWIKYHASAYLLTTATPNVANGVIQTTSTAGRIFVGYDNTRTLSNMDANRPTLQASGISSATLLAITGSGEGAIVRNIILDGNSLSSITGCTQSTTGLRSYNENVKALNCTTGFSGGFCLNCFADGCTTGFSGSRCFGCQAKNGTTGFSLGNAESAIHCIAHGCSGDGFLGTAFGSYVQSCTARGCGDGFDITGTYSFASSCLAYGNTSVGFRIATSALLRNCSGGSNTSGNTSTTGIQIPTLIVLTADPFVDAANGNFALNNTAGGGAALRAAGFPGAFPGGTTTGYLDIGAVQHQDAGGGGTQGISQGLHAIESGIAA